MTKILFKIPKPITLTLGSSLGYFAFMAEDITEIIFLCSFLSLTGVSFVQGLLTGKIHVKFFTIFIISLFMTIVTPLCLLCNRVFFDITEGPFYLFLPSIIIIILLTISFWFIIPNLNIISTICKASEGFIFLLILPFHKVIESTFYEYNINSVVLFWFYILPVLPILTAESAEYFGSKMRLKICFGNKRITRLNLGKTPVTFGANRKCTVRIAGYKGSAVSFLLRDETVYCTEGNYLRQLKPGDLWQIGNARIEVIKNQTIN